jgi:Tol biopolymer transport system component
MRLRDIGEARVALAQASRAPALVPAIDARTLSTMTRRRARGSAIAWAVAAAFAAIAALTLWAPWVVEPDRPLVRLDVDLGADVALPVETFDQNVVISPDSKRLAYFSRGSSGQTRLSVRRLDQDTAMELPGTEGAVSATFSPDSNSLAFLRGNGVYRISVQGGAALRLSEGDVSSNSLAWTENGSILLAGIGAGLRRIPAGGGEQVKVSDLADGEAIHAQPFPLPGGKTVLFASGTQLRNSRIEVISTSGGPRKVVIQDGTAPHYLAGGYLAYLSQGTLFAIRFDPDTLETRGDPVPIVTDVKLTYSGLAPVGTFSISNDGTLVYRRAASPLGAPGPAGRRSTISWIDAIGKRSPLLTKVGAYGDPRVSPDGSQIALTVVDTPPPFVATYDPRRDSLTRVSFQGANVDAVWTPNGRYLVFLTLSGTVDGGLTWTHIGGGQPRPLVKEGVRALGSFSPDGKWLAYVTRGGIKGRPLTTQIVTVPVMEETGQLKSGDPQSFSPSQFGEREPEFSSDGKWVAFVTDRSGRDEVAVRAFPISSSGPSAEAVLSNNGGINPRWSRNGRELLYLEGDRIMRVTFTVNGGVFVPDKPQVFLEKAARQWDLAPDGRLAMIEPVETQSGTVPVAEHHVVFLEHFIDEVKRRVK